MFLYVSFIYLQRNMGIFLGYIKLPHRLLHLNEVNLQYARIYTDNCV